MEDMRHSRDRWSYVIILSKFIVHFVEVAMTKSFGVLLPTMMDVFSTDASSLGFVCSLPTSMMFLSCLPMAYLLNSGHISPRMMAIIGAVLSSLGIIIAGFLTSVIGLGFCLTFTGIGLAMGYLPIHTLLNDYFQEDYVLMNSISNLGTTAGALVVPVIIERALQAYGFSGAMLILGGISLHAVVASITLRTKKSSHESTRTKRGNDDLTQEMPEEVPLMDSDDDNQRVISKTIDDDDNAVSSKEDGGSREFTDDNISSTGKNVWYRRCICVKEPLLSVAIPCLFLIPFVIQSWILFLVPRAEWHGVPGSRAVLLSSIGGGAGIVGRMLCIVFLHFGVDFIVVFLVLGIVSSITFLIDPLLVTFPLMCASAFIQGFCIFSSGLAAAAFLKSSVSNENFTVASGILGLVYGLGGTVGSLISGMIKDKTGSYTVAFLALGFINCASVLFTILFMIARWRWNTIKGSGG